MSDPSQVSGAHRVVSSLSVLDRAGRGTPLAPPQPMPPADLRVRLPMRDGAKLDTRVWRPAGDERVPAILLRTPYKESTMGFRRLGVLRYVEAGYAVVIQQIRGVGESEGRYAFNAPHERDDGYETVEWIAGQPWCTGAVGMDGSSYVAMTQIAAAVARPPNLRCIVPAVPCMNFFREIPYCGGIFSRQHTLNWMRLVQIDTLDELSMGFAGTLPLVSDRAHLERMTRRPLAGAAEGLLEGDYLRHYLDALAHPTFDAFWRERTIAAEELGRIEIPALVVSGNFDLGLGAMTLWRGLMSRGRAHEDTRLLVGPWDHGQCYAGGAARHGPYDFGEAAVLDLGALRLAFFDRHLKRQGDGLPWREKVRLFVTGTHRWRALDAYPPRESESRTWFLASEGRANSSRGDGALLDRVDPARVQPDHFVDDPTLPFVAGLALADEPDSHFDLRERERHHDTLVYDSGPLREALTVVGEGEVELHTCADVPDADVIVWLAEHRADGATVRLAFAQLRLRYRGGFEAQVPLVPGEPVRIRLALNYVAHTLPAGSRLRLLVSGSNFPWADPNPHTGEPISTAVVMRSARQTLFHDELRPSCLRLPVLR